MNYGHVTSNIALVQAAPHYLNNNMASLVQSLAIFAAVLAVSSGQSKLEPQKSSFKYLAVTLPTEFNPFKIFSARKYWFNKIPLTVTDALKEKWTRMNGSDCENGGRYAGTRYLPEKEQSIAALYDSNGVVAGIQALYKVQSILYGTNDGGCSKGWNRASNSYRFNDQPMINREKINGVEYFVLTAYFTNPRKICESCRNPLKVSTDGFGSSLYLQQGPTSYDLLKAPKNRTLAKEHGWSNNKCLPFNGHHNFYQSEQWDADQCNSFRPSWLFYDGVYELSGFGFSLPGCDGSWRFQHPPAHVVDYVLGGSKCAKEIASNIGFSNINVYLKKPAATMVDCVDKTGFLSKVINFFTP